MIPRPPLCYVSFGYCVFSSRRLAARNTNYRATAITKLKLWSNGCLSGRNVSAIIRDFYKMFVLSALCFILYLIDRLMQVKSIELSTPRGFNVLRNFNSAPNNASVSIKLTDANVLDAFKTMNFHRTKMNEFLYDSFLRSRPAKPSDNDAAKKKSNFIQDVGSNSYRTWLMRTIGSPASPKEGIYTRDYDALYTKGHFTEPFYKVRDGVEDEDIYFAMSFPAYHEQRYQKHTTSYPSQSTYDQTTWIAHAKIPMISSGSHKNNKNYVEWELNKNIIGVDLYDKAVNLTETYRNRLKSTLTPRVSFQQLSNPSTSPTSMQLPTEPVPPFVTPSISLERNTMEAYYSVENVTASTEMSLRSNWMSYDSGEHALRPPTEADNYTLGYTYSAPRTETTMGTYPNNQFYPVFTENPIDLTYPPYYPSHQDTSNGYNAVAAPYGNPVTTEKTRDYGPPYGDWYSVKEPDNPSYGSEYVFHPPNDEKPNDHHHEAEEVWYFDHPPKHDELGIECDCGGEQEMEESEDGRLSTISNILGPDSYELVLTAIAFMAFGTYFMNMMMKITEPNSGATTMMIVANGNDNGPNIEENVAKFFHDDANLRLVENILLSIEELQQFTTANGTQSSDNNT